MRTLGHLFLSGVALFTSAVSLSAESRVGKPAPAFTITETSGKKTTIASLKGNVIVCQGLFTWCPHCQAFSQMASKLSEQYGPKGLRVVGVAFDDDVNAAKVNEYTSKYAKFPVGIATRNEVLGFFGIPLDERVGVPQVMVIDRKGIVRAQSEPSGGGEFSAESNLRPLIEKLLADGAPASKGASPSPAKPASKGTAKKTSE